MKITEVAKLTPENRFLYWMAERHSIYLRRSLGEPKPWTNDEVLQSYFFTNPYRENDKTTAWFRENVREPMRDDPRVLLATVAFRWFNLIETGEVLLREGLFEEWNLDHALEVLTRRRDEGHSLFTGAYMINSPPGKGKMEAICDRITEAQILAGGMVSDIGGSSLEDAHKVLLQLSGFGGFMAYEVVCDLRYTYLLEGAEDKETWCNPGPGCIRGLYRLNGWEFDSRSGHGAAPPIFDGWLEQMQSLLRTAQRKLSKMPPLEMREIEHSLCESDKYERARLQDGKMKRRYNGRGD